MTRAGDLRAIDTALTLLTRVGHSRRARRRIEERSGVPLGSTAVSVLAAVRALAPARHGAVARRTGVQPSRMSKEIRLLVDAGYVTERPDPADRRAALLELTPAGLDAYQRYRQATEEVLAEVLAEWSDADIEDLRTRLGRLADAFAVGPPK